MRAYVVYVCVGVCVSVNEGDWVEWCGVVRRS